MNSPHLAGRPQAAGLDWRVVAVALAGFCTFLDLYATQPLLPLFVRLFHAPTAQASLTVSAATLAVALGAPFAGLPADRVGRKPVIAASIFRLVLPTALAATATTLHALIFWRLLQGLCMPGIFAVTMAYISEEWAGGAGPAMAGYVTGNVLGGFSGRFLSGLIAGHFGWREAFVVLAALNGLGEVAVWRWPPPSSRFRSESDRGASFQAMREHLQNPTLLATYAAGDLCCRLQRAVLIGGDVHLCHVLFGRAAVPAGDAGPRLGLPDVSAGRGRPDDTRAAPPVCQSAASSFAGKAAGHARSSATGLYVTFYYTGGSAGSTLTGLFWACRR